MAGALARVIQGSKSHLGNYSTLVQDNINLFHLLHTFKHPDTILRMEKCHCYCTRCVAGLHNFDVCLQGLSDLL